MENLSHYGSYALAEAAVQNSNSSAQQNALILFVIEQLNNQVVNCTKINLENKSVNDTLTAELERYKEQIKILKEGQNVDLTSKGNVSDSCAQSVVIDLLKQTLLEHLKENESLMQTVTLLKNDFKKEESRNIDREIVLEKRIKQLDNIVFKRDQSAQTIHMLTKPQFFYDHTTKQALGFQNLFNLKKAQQLEPKLYVGDIIEKTNLIVIPDSEETLLLAEESHSKMILRQKDPIMLEKKVNTTPIDYNSVNSPEPIISSRPTIVEVPKELPKVSMVNTSLKKLKHHLADFDVVVKERTTPTAITKGSWGFEHTKACFRDEIIPFVKALKDLFNTFNQYLVDELSEVQNVFHQMEQAVEQHHLESKTFEVKMNQVLNENERLLEQVISKDIVNILVNSSVNIASMNVHECENCLKLETELLNKKDFVEKEIYNKLFKSFTTLEKHCISLEVDIQHKQEIFQRDNFISNQRAPSFYQLFELSELKAQSQEKDTVIKKLKERIKSLSGKQNEDKIKKGLEEIETINIELDHREKVLVITPLKNDLRKLKGKALVDNDVTKHPSDPEMLKIDVEPITLKLLNKQTAHSAYIKHTQEEAIVLRDLVEHVKSKYLLDQSLEFACRYAKLVQELLTNISKTCPRVKPSTSASGSQPSGNTKKDKIRQTPSSTQKNKVEAHPRKVKSSLKNKDCVVQPKGTAHVQHSKLNANSELKCVKCDGCMLSDNYDFSKRKVWKPTGKVFSNIGYIWRPTGRTLTIVGNVCPLTRITTTTKVPLRKPTALKNETPKPVVTLVYSRKPRKSKLMFLLANLRSSKLFSGTVKFQNDHVEKILGYGDYQIGNITISRVYYVEGASETKSWLWHWCLSHLNFGAINHLARHGLVRGLPKLKFKKDHLCSACAMGKSKKKVHKPKSEDTNQEKLYGSLWTNVCHFDDLTTMASEHSSSGPALHDMTPTIISLGLVPNPPPSTPFIPPSRTDWDILFQPQFNEFLTPLPTIDYPAPEVIAPIAEVVALVPVVSTGSPSSTNVDQDAPSPNNSQTTPETQPLVIPNDVEEDNHDIEVARMGNDLYFGIPIPKVHYDQSSSSDTIHTIVHHDHQISKHNSKWTKDHLLDRPVSTRLQLHKQALFCYYDAFLTVVEPKTYKDALTQSC
ncbi:retrovirus-related pol polyprotein from transposon TNT 1-94 [Tanacetum coccineum]